MDIVRVRFRKIDDRWYVWTRMFGSSGVAGSGDLELFDQRKLLHVQQLGVGKVRVIEPDEVVTLLRVSAKQPSDAEDREQVPFVGRFGSQSAWTKQQSKGG